MFASLARYGFVFCVCALLACAPDPKATRSAPRVWAVGARDLWTYYSNGGSDQWDGQHVRIRLPSANYTVNGREVCWHPNRMTAPPGIVFLFDRPPEDNTKALEFVGRVKGRLQGLGGEWLILVTDCAIITP